MNDNETRLKDNTAKAQKLLDDICLDIIGAQNSLTQLLVRCHRAGGGDKRESACWIAIQDAIQDAHTAYSAAIAQPEPRATNKSRVNLSQL